MEDEVNFNRWFGRAKTLVLQPTTLCNLDCVYCYLPFRRLSNEMSPEVAQAVAASAADLTGSGDELDIVWHGGEPLALGRRRFAALLAPFEELRHAGRIQHSVQTNATLIDDEWCDLLACYQVRVGVSIDGPAALNTRRVDLRGRPAFDRIVCGIRRLANYGIRFSLIAVVGAEGIEQPESLLDFLADLGPHSIGLNVEEMEGVNDQRCGITQDQAERFWHRVLDWRKTHDDGPALRELDRLAGYLHLSRSGRGDEWCRYGLDPIPTVSVDGGVVLLSPELAGISDDTYGDFLAGNVRSQSIVGMLDKAHRLRYVREFMVGLQRCEAECEFWDFCRGAQACNRYFENGSFATTETDYCRLTRQALITALYTATKKENAA
ncbi:cyclophane-forming radical SAM peptide maturase AmcB [Streptosporangium sp. NPDC049248]|uniref:cyclophane-forming radical SAM peptide maturase AmcB n=1 Tax=Streptosporangium sp. NPDC049248 TaxID=3155651 RepID=UPI0034197B9D